ncbi:MAG: hypothetical protein ACI8YC_001692 [Salibacteraceae bacterium]|jgi:hypothetical protein
MFFHIYVSLCLDNPAHKKDYYTSSDMLNQKLKAVVV